MILGAALIIVIGLVLLLVSMFSPSKNQSNFLGIGNTKYTSDSEHVYDANKKIIPGANPKTFAVVDSSWNEAVYAHDIYSKDDMRVYYQKSSDQSVEVWDGVDAQTFENIDKTIYFKDKNHIYVGFKQILKDADPLTFHVMKSSSENIYLGVDKNYAYAGDVKIREAQVKTLQSVTGAVFKDDKNAYSISYANGVPNYRVMPIDTSKPFTMVGEDYIRYDGHIYYASSLKIITTADAETFGVGRVYPDGKQVFDYKDKNHRYDTYGQVIDIKELEDPHSLYYVDPKNPDSKNR